VKTITEKEELVEHNYTILEKGDGFVKLKINK